MVYRLDGFHTSMSFLGSIGNLINDPGLEEAFQEVYSKNTIIHILLGHAVARDVRAQSVLVNHISNTLIDKGNVSVSGLESFYSIAIENEINKEQVTDVSNSDAFINMVNAISNCSKEK